MTLPGYPWVGRNDDPTARAPVGDRCLKLDGCMDGSMDAWMDEWIAGWMHGWMKSGYGMGADIEIWMKWHIANAGWNGWD